MRQTHLIGSEAYRMVQECAKCPHKTAALSDMVAVSHPDWRKLFCSAIRAYNLSAPLFGWPVFPVPAACDSPTPPAPPSLPEGQ